MWWNSILVTSFLLVICTAMHVDDVDHLIDKKLPNIHNNHIRKHMVLNMKNSNHKGYVKHEVHSYGGNDILKIMLEEKLKSKKDTENDESISNENKKMTINNINEFKNRLKYSEYNKLIAMSNLIPSLVSMTKGMSIAVLEIVPLNIQNYLDTKTMSEEINDLRRDQKFYYRSPKRYKVRQNSDDGKLIKNHNNYYVVLLKNLWEIWPFTIQSLLQNVEEEAEYNTSVSEWNEENKEILRDDGDDCVKAQVKKCFKALKDIPKKSCEIYYCKSEFKKKFKYNSKTACIDLFTGRKGNGGKHWNKTVSINKKKLACDMTRVGFDCDGGVYDLKKYERKDSGHTLGFPDDSKLDVLREKHEKACQKKLSKKCILACEKTIRITCESFKCQNAQKRSMKKECKKKCNNIFITSKSSESKESSKSSEEESDKDSTDSD